MEELTSKDFVKDLSHLTVNQINNAVKQLVNTLDITSGSTSDIQLYQLLQVYLKDIDKRSKINSILYS